MLHRKPDQSLNPDLPTQGEVSDVPTAYMIPDHRPAGEPREARFLGVGLSPRQKSLRYTYIMALIPMTDSSLGYHFLLLWYPVIPNLAA